MHIKTLRAKRALTQAHDRATGPTPREEAIRWLQQTIAADRAGLDPWDATILLIDPHPFEERWARAVVEMCGLFLSYGHAGRIRCIVQADVRDLLGLDKPDAPTMADEPLASRRADIAVVARDLTQAPTALMDTLFSGTEHESTVSDDDFPAYAAAVREDVRLHVIDPETESAAAIRRARAAYDERQVH